MSGPDILSNHKKMSTKLAFLLFLVVAIVMGPAVYAKISHDMFLPSPGWKNDITKTAFITGAVLAVISLPFMFVMTRNSTSKTQRVSILFVGPASVLAMVLMVCFYSLPVMLTMVHEIKPTSYTVTVSSKTRTGKMRCEYPFSIEELGVSLCASSADEYTKLREGGKIELFGKGNEYGLFIEGYRSAD